MPLGGLVADTAPVGIVGDLNETELLNQELIADATPRRPRVLCQVCRVSVTHVADDEVVSEAVVLKRREEFLPLAIGDRLIDPLLIAGGLSEPGTDLTRERRVARTEVAGRAPPADL